MTAATVPALPLLKPWYRLARDGDRLVLEYAHVAVVLKGRAVPTLLPPLLPLLDGTRSVRTIVAELGEAVAPAVTAALELLARHDLLTEGPQLAGAAPPSQAATAELLAATLSEPRSPAEALRSLAAARCVVAGTGGGARLLARLLRRAGVGDVSREERMTLPAADADLLVAVPAPAALRELPALNRQALEAGTPWLPVLPFDGRLAALGPLVVPRESCCYECYLLRRAANSPFADEFWLLERSVAAYPSSPALDATAAGLAAQLALRWLVARDRALPGVLFALEHPDVPGLTTHPVLRVPRCPACGGVAGASAPAPWFDEPRAEAA